MTVIGQKSGKKINLLKKQKKLHGIWAVKK